MADLGRQFNSNEVEPNEAFDVVPASWYVARLVASERQESASTPGNSYVKCEWVIDEAQHPDYANRRIFQNINLWNSNETAVKIAEGELSAICRAAGKEVIGDTDELHHVPIAIKVGVRPARGEYGPQNVIKGFDSAEKRFGSGAAPTSKGGKPAAPAAGSSGKPSWAR